MKVKVKTLDGATYEAEGPFASLADRIAFERRFGVTATVMGRMAKAFNAEGELADDADPAQVSEEHVAFMVYRLIARAHPDAFASFDAFVDRAEELELEDEDEAANPTGAIPTPQLA